MREDKFLLKPEYKNSKALIIGINQYLKASPLAYAVSDANGVSEVLVNELGFKKENVTTLIDNKATKTKILKIFSNFSKSDTELDDRVIVFFAGHGHTRTGLRGEVGYLVPYDADMDDFSTLIRWDELTKNSELIRAKHILFVMDACYGGLAVNRKMEAGSTRFLKDMLLRFSRQVITAGKANEVVSDSGGPLAGHSVFTGHFIEGLMGNAADEQKNITASGLMAYVYNKVANDPDSNQTPHYGQFDGDGDFIISSPFLKDKDEDETKDTDCLISVPMAEMRTSTESREEKVKIVKELLSKETSVIELHDFVVREIRNFLAATAEDNFSVRGQFSKEELLQRISKYEEIVQDLVATTTCIAYWARLAHMHLLQKVIRRCTDHLAPEGGLTIWINLRWYPLILQSYNMGVACIESQRFDSLYSIFTTKISGASRNGEDEMFVELLSDALLELTRSDVFKQIPGHEKQYTPISEYLYKNIQPNIDDNFFIGKGYEKAFDDFEIFLALVIADIQNQKYGRVWGPIGRFGWKASRHMGDSTTFFDILILDAEQAGKDWKPFKAGFFGSDVDRFKNIVKEFEKIISNLNWW